MKFLDHVLQNWRISKVRPYIKVGSRLLDIGCADGTLLKQLGSRLSGGIGVDPDLAADTSLGKIQLLKGYFPDAIPDSEPFDVITMLAVLEHFPPAAYSKLAQSCADYLRPGGRLLVTVPSPMVDYLLNLLSTLRLIDGMSLEQHHGYDVSQTPSIFVSEHFLLIHRKRFQLGLNNLFVFQR